MGQSDLAATEKTWPILAALILSEQISERRLAEIERDHPDFWAWLGRQMVQATILRSDSTSRSPERRNGDREVGDTGANFA